MGTLTASNLKYDSAGTELKVSGTFSFGTAYNNTGNDTTTGESIAAAALGMSLIKRIKLQPEKGYDFECLGLGTGNGVTSARIKAYAMGAAGGTSGAEAAHTHAVALDGGTSAAGSAHTHGMAGAATDAGSAHTHAITPGGTIDNEGAHTHAVALDGGASGAGDAHTHIFTGTAITADTFTVAHDATPETSVVYINSLDGVLGFLSSDNSADNASDYFATAGTDRVVVIDDNGAAVVATALRFQVYFDEDGAQGARLLINNTITAKDLYVRTAGGNLIKFKHDAAAAATGVALYFDDNGADATLRLNATLPGAANITTTQTDTTYKGLIGVSAGTNANESTHTHGPGTLADAASGVGSAHSHGITGLTASAANESAHTHGVTGLTVANESAHTHGPGTLADAASGAGASHTHSISASAGGEVTNGTNLYTAGLTAVEFEAYGY